MGLVEVAGVKKKNGRRGGRVTTIVGPLCSSGCKSQNAGGGWAAASPSPSLTVYEHQSQQRENKAE